MSFMVILNSLDELLYEVASWLVFYPVTLWRAVSRPWQMMTYADTELADAPDKQYPDVLSPPLFLLLTLLISHGVELALTGDSPLVKDNIGVASLIDSDTNLIAMRMVAFAVFPLFSSVLVVRRKRLKLDRDTLKLPFYSQCYATAPMALLVGLGGTLVQLKPMEIQLAAAVMMFGGVIWFLVIQTGWFRRELGISWSGALGNALLAYMEAMLVLLLASTLLL